MVNAVIRTQWALKKLCQLSRGYLSAPKLWDLWLSEAILPHLLQQPRKLGVFRDSCELGVWQAWFTSQFRYLLNRKQDNLLAGLSVSSSVQQLLPLTAPKCIK